MRGADPHRRSWRHGSIAWRQAYLLTLIGRPLDALPIDRLIRRTKVAVAVILLLGVGAVVALERPAERRYTDNDQQAEFPGDKGFELVAELQAAEIIWNQT